MANLLERVTSFVRKGPAKELIPYGGSSIAVYPRPAREFVAAQVFWPDWPSQSTAVPLGASLDLTQSSLIMAAVNWAGTVFAEPLVRVLREDKANQDEWVPVRNHPLQKIWEQPNPYYSGATMMKAFAFYWLTNGNVYVLKKRDKLGRVRELWLLDSNEVSAEWPEDGSEFISNYVVRRDNESYVIEKSDIIHFRYGLDPRNHRYGLAPVRALIDEVMSDEAAMYYSKNVLGKGGIPPYFLWPKPNADAVYTIDQAKVKESLMASTTGSNAGTPAVFSAPMELAHVGFTPQQMALKESHTIPEERVCAVLGIPGLVLGFNFDTHATYSNYKTALEAAWNTFVIPTMKLFATELTNQLLPEYDYRNGEWVEFDTSDVWALQADEKQIAEKEVMKFKAGLVTRNEARVAMGMKAYEGEGGDDLAPIAAGDTSVPMMDETKAMRVEDRYDELRDWWRKFGPEDAQGILDAEQVR
jgi:HK97 family phage portal protein